MSPDRPKIHGNDKDLSLAPGGLCILEFTSYGDVGMGLDADNLKLTDFMDLATLQEVQDSFAAVANVKATITDAAGNLLTQPTPTREFLRRQSVLAEEGEQQPQREGAEFVAPIMVNNQRLGTIRMSATGALNGCDEEKLLAI